MGGAFQIARDIFDNPIWRNITEFRLFFLILGNAIYREEGKDKGDIHLERGQWLRSYRNIQSDLEYMENNTLKQPGMATIKRAIEKLTADGRITTKQTELGTLFTVLNYAKYQGFDHYKTEGLEQQRNTCGTPAEHLRNNNNKDNKVKKDNIYTPEFERWYSEYPRPQAKKDTFKSFEKVRKQKGLEIILQCTKNYMDYINSLPSEKREFCYSSNNFLGQKAYYLDFMEPKKYVEQKTPVQQALDKMM